jgi:predicted phosphate transport protein (TIGR00153 family)
MVFKEIKKTLKESSLTDPVGALGKAKEETVLEMIRIYIDKVVTVVNNLPEVVNSYVEEKFDQTEKEVQEMIALEKEADEMKRLILNELSRGGIYPVNREDLLSLVRSLDEIANMAVGAAYRILLRKFKLSEEMKQNLLELAREDVVIVKKLRESLLAMRPSMRKAIELSHAVEEIEEKADAIYRVLYKNLFEMETDFKTFNQLREIIVRLEEIADKAEETAEIVRLIAIKYIDFG